jgi:hypothetical protein
LGSLPMVLSIGIRSSCYNWLTDLDPRPPSVLPSVRSLADVWQKFF